MRRVHEIRVVGTSNIGKEENAIRDAETCF